MTLEVTSNEVCKNRIPKDNHEIFRKKVIKALF